MTWRVLEGDCLTVLPTLPAESVQCCVTSPPYWGLRDYGLAPQTWGGDPACKHDWGDLLPPKPGPGNAPGDLSTSSLTNPERQNTLPRAKDAGAFCRACGAWSGSLGLEPTPDLYVTHVVDVFREVRRVLKSDGVLWLNLGDCYATGAGKVGDHPGGGEQGARWAGDVNRHRDPLRRDPGATRATRDGRHAGKHTGMTGMGPMTQPNRMPIAGLKPKDLVGIPWRVAFALQADGWWLRSDCIWSKPNPMPESVQDRPTRSHEYVFLLSKSEHYFYDSAAIRETAVEVASGNKERQFRKDAGGVSGDARGHQGFGVPWENDGTGRNRRSVWTITTKPFTGAHFAVMPWDLVEPCVLAGSGGGGNGPRPLLRLRDGGDGRAPARARVRWRRAKSDLRRAVARAHYQGLPAAQFGER